MDVQKETRTRSYRNKMRIMVKIWAKNYRDNQNSLLCNKCTWGVQK